MTSDKQYPPHPPKSADKDLCDCDAVTLRRMISACDISPVELLESCISRINAVNPAVNAVVATCYDQARAEAKTAEAAVRNNVALPPLHGLPILIKDLSDTKGLRTTYGSLCFADHVPDEDSAVVNRLRQAGAIVIGKTNTPEFGVGANTYNKVYGATPNPFDLKLTSGGSSGGSAAALACGMAPLATGSDLGGSLRIPASFCSVVGMRPSPGLVPSTSHTLGFSPLWTDGPIARSVADAAMCLEALAGYDKRDPLSSPTAADFGVHLEDAIDLGGLKVGFSTDLGVAAIDQNITKIFDDRKTQLRQRFAASEDLSLDLSEAADVFRVLRAEDIFASFANLAQTKSDQIGENVRVNLMEAQKLTLADTARAAAAHTLLFRDFQTLFDDIDILICPATAVSPFPVHDNHPQTINGVPLDGYYAWYAITWALSLMGCPIVTLPCGMDHNAMPFGIQIVAGRDQDAFVLQVAFALEHALSIDGPGRITPDISLLTRN
jgi:amidase